MFGFYVWFGFIWMFNFNLIRNRYYSWSLVRVRRLGFVLNVRKDLKSGYLMEGGLNLVREKNFVIYDIVWK